jgi:Fic/DOC family
MALIVSPPSSDPRHRQLRRLATAGKLRRLYSGVYTDDLQSPLSSVARREAFALAAVLAPGAVISHRSALASGISDSGVIHLTGSSRRDHELEGLTLRVRKGPAPIASDARIPTIVPGAFTYRSSNARALLENLELTRSRAGREAPTAGREAVEAWLDTFLARHDEAALNRLRDQARDVSAELGLAREFAILDSIVGTLMGTRDRHLTHPHAAARVRGLPVDGQRVDLFRQVAQYLNSNPPLVPQAGENQRDRMQSFVESYFSNYIEGTEFVIEEALEIVNSRSPQEFREDDSHDVIGTFDAIEASKANPVMPDTTEGFEAVLKGWNRQVLFSRASKQPGEWKVHANQAGATLFVRPDLVRGTLLKGFELIAASPLPEARAALAKFVVAEIHPFQDGNGRTSRLLMNLILSQAGLTRIVIPTVFREDYLLALKALTNDGHTEPYVRMLTAAARFSALLDYTAPDRVLAQLDRSNAKQEPNVAKLNLAALS